MGWHVASSLLGGAEIVIQSVQRGRNTRLKALEVLDQRGEPRTPEAEVVSRRAGIATLRRIETLACVAENLGSTQAPAARQFGFCRWWAAQEAPHPDVLCEYAILSLYCIQALAQVRPQLVGDARNLLRLNGMCCKD